MKPLLTIATGAILMFAATGCDLLESHPYDVNISGDKHLTSKNISRIEKITAGKNSIKFAMISDTQRGYDETREVVKLLNRRGDLDFVVHGGDLTEFGSTREYEWQRDILEELKMPYVCVIGNHDCQATGIDAYLAMYGPLNFSFVAGNVRFLCINTNALEFDYPAPVPDLGFLKKELEAAPAGAEKTVVLMHAAPYSEQFNNNIAEETHALFRRFPGLQFCLYGHGHNIKAGDIFGDGVMYYECANILKRSYLLFTINPDDSYEYEVVHF